jgi:hypothetical protein
MSKKKKVIELSVLSGDGKGKPTGQPPENGGTISVEDVIKELYHRKGKILRLTCTVEEDGCFYVLHNNDSMTNAERGFLVLLTMHEMLSSFHTFVGHPDHPEDR